jgi:uncharacterized protein (TIGR00730 family)
MMTVANRFQSAIYRCMTEKDLTERRFHKAKQEARFVEKQELQTPQTMSKSYRLAFQDTEFLLREELRPVRFQLELLKPEMLLDEAGIASMLVIYGSARIPEPAKADALLAAATDDRSRIIAQRLKDKSRYYDEARKLAQIASECGIIDADGSRHFVVCSGGGPSIMEAANRGAADVGAESVGMNIVLPHEQAPNVYVTPDLSFQFHYFALRKMHFLLRARAVAVFPGGFGTFDEFFELLTLIQTGKMERMPILLFGKDFWSRVVNFEELMLEGVISPRDLDLFTPVENAEDAWHEITKFYEIPGKNGAI